MQQAIYTTREVRVADQGRWEEARILPRHSLDCLKTGCNACQLTCEQIISVPCNNRTPSLLCRHMDGSFCSLNVVHQSLGRDCVCSAGRRRILNDCLQAASSHQVQFHFGLSSLHISPGLCKHSPLEIRATKQSGPRFRKLKKKNYLYTESTTLNPPLPSQQTMKCLGKYELIQLEENSN
jgi:hypothetical protein